MGRYGQAHRRPIPDNKRKQRVEEIMPRRPRLSTSFARAAALAVSALLLSFGTAGLAAAQDAPKLLGKYDDWSAYSYGSGSERMCYAMSAPTRMLPAGANRGDVYFMVTHRPGRNTRNEISMRAGYIFKTTSRPFATIGSDKFQMFNGTKEGGEHQYWAWLENPSEEGKMVQALKAGSSMEIKGTSSRDTLTTDTYSLKGSAAALKKIDETCK
ncbi:hypothetical protein [uncultured Parvibaculum sp.]|uniref:hypothetical protein n=1 Tax=uncultured Parvibaculum sp. TaxID=291828 RepID=UPI0030EC8B53|tara:strand:+ start:7763 stop:8401 length:639 start_codon:yes stop_codon:yes gene_type:complete